MLIRALQGRDGKLSLGNLRFTKNVNRVQGNQEGTVQCLGASNSWKPLHTGPEQAVGLQRSGEELFGALAFNKVFRHPSNTK